MSGLLSIPRAPLAWTTRCILAFEALALLVLTVVGIGDGGWQMSALFSQLPGIWLLLGIGAPDAQLFGGDGRALEITPLGIPILFAANTVALLILLTPAVIVAATALRGIRRACSR